MPPKLFYQESTGLAKPAAQIMNNIANFILYNQVLSELQATIANFIAGRTVVAITKASTALIKERDTKMKQPSN